MLRLGAAVGFALLLATVPAHAFSTTYAVVMNGAPEAAQLIGLATAALAVMRRLRRPVARSAG